FYRHDAIPISYLINAPNFYLYDGIYPCYTLHSLEQLLERGIVSTVYDITLKRKLFKRTFRIQRPYFTNALEASIEIDKGLLHYVWILILSNLKNARSYIKSLGILKKAP